MSTGEEDQRVAVGLDGLTPQERLEMRGYEFDERGRTIALGHGAEIDAFEADPWEWLEGREPDLTLVCPGMSATSDTAPDDGSSRVVIALVWRVHPDHRRTWYRSAHYQGRVTDWVTEDGHLPVVCPAHGLTLVEARRLVEDAASPRRQLPVLCTDPSPV